MIFFFIIGCKTYFNIIIGPLEWTLFHLILSLHKAIAHSVEFRPERLILSLETEIIRRHYVGPFSASPCA